MHNNHFVNGIKLRARPFTDLLLFLTNTDIKLNLKIKQIRSIIVPTRQYISTVGNDNVVTMSDVTFRYVYVASRFDIHQFNIVEFNGYYLLYVQFSFSLRLHGSDRFKRYDNVCKPRSSSAYY